MGKAGTWMQGARGKTADLVFQKGRNGKTIQRKYVVPTNPQTAAQMAQRIIFATVNQAASFMDPIINHSFEGLSKEASRQEFIKRNIARLRSYAATDYEEAPDPSDSLCFMTTKGVSQLIPNKYIIANGSLRDTTPFAVTSSTGTLATKFAGFSVPTTPSQTEGVVVVRGSDILNALGFYSGKDQLTWCEIFLDENNVIFAYDNQNIAGFAIKSTYFQAARLVPAANGFSLTHNITVASFDETVLKDLIRQIFDVSKSSEQALVWLEEMLIHGTATIEQGTITVAPNDYAGVPGHQYGGSWIPVAGCIIMSRLNTNGKWLRSKAEMELVAMGSANWGLNWNTAIPAWFETRQLTDNEQYLNEGGDSNTI